MTVRVIPYEDLRPLKGINADKSTIWRWIRAKKWPKPIKLGGKNCWVESEVDRAIAHRMAERDGKTDEAAER